MYSVLDLMRWMSGNTVLAITDWTESDLTVSIACNKHSTTSMIFSSSIATVAAVAVVVAVVCAREPAAPLICLRATPNNKRSLLSSNSSPNTMKQSHLLLLLSLLLLLLLLLKISLSISLQPLLSISLLFLLLLLLLVIVWVSGKGTENTIRN